MAYLRISWERHPTEGVTEGDSDDERRASLDRPAGTHPAPDLAGHSGLAAWLCSREATDDINPKSREVDSRERGRPYNKMDKKEGEGEETISIEE